MKWNWFVCFAFQCASNATTMLLLFQRERKGKEKLNENEISTLITLTGLRSIHFSHFSWMECCARWFGKMWTQEVAQKLLLSNERCIQLPKQNKTKQKKVANKQTSQTKKRYRDSYAWNKVTPNPFVICAGVGSFQLHIATNYHRITSSAGELV